MTDEHISAPSSSKNVAKPAEFLTPAQVAGKLGVAKTSLYDLLARGRIAHYRVGRLIRIKEADVVAYLTANRVEALQPGERRSTYRWP